jgi:hypothetical protein
VPTDENHATQPTQPLPDVTVAGKASEYVVDVAIVALGPSAF